MIGEMQLDERPNWQRRVGNSKIEVARWKEGRMATLMPSYADNLGQFLASTTVHLFDNLNKFFSAAEVPAMPSYPDISPSEMMSAMAKSWAHQEETLPIRVDIAAMKDGSFRLIGVAADEWVNVPQILNATKNCMGFHFEGDPSIVEVNFLMENISELLAKYGERGQPRSVYGAAIFLDSADKDEEATAVAMSSVFGDHSGIILNGIKAVSSVVPEHFVAFEGKPQLNLKVTSWKSLLEGTLGSGDVWAQMFQETGAFVLQPAWTYALDNLVDVLDSPPEQEDVSKVLNIWMDFHNRSPINAMVASDYFDGYSFSEASFYPAVVASSSEE